MPASAEILALAREREAAARRLLLEASENPAADVCDDAWMTASIFQTLLDYERQTTAKLKEILNAVPTQGT